MRITPRICRRSSYRLVIEALENRTLLSAYTVDSLADNGQGSGLTGDLRYCITQATSGHDTIDFSITGTIDLTRPLPTLSTSLTITGPGAANLIVQRNSAGNFRIFDVAAAATIQISGLTIANGSEAQGAGIRNNGNLTVRDSSINGNATLSTGSTSQGGGLYNSGTLTVSGTTFSRNSSPLRNVSSGGAIYNDGTCTFTNSIFTGNAADHLGGAIFSDKGLSVIGCRFDGNSTAMFSLLGSYGGAIYLSGTLRLGDSSFTGNSAAQGGGLYVGGGTADISASTFVTNSGGAIWNSGTVILDNSTVSKNTGGGISNGGLGTVVVITNSTVSGNSGGGIINNGGTLTMTDSTVSGNSASDGGGIYNAPPLFGSARASITGCTIAFNSASNGGGIDLKTTAQIRNTIIANNKGSMGPDLFGTFSSLGHNLILDPAQGSGFVSSDLLRLDPLLGPLQDNGGPTFTHALLPGSPAIGAGDPTNAPATDQRGLPRIVNGSIDIGAFEVQSPGTTVTKLALSAPSKVSAGAPFNVTVSALGADGSVVASYTGTVTFTSSLAHPGLLPSDYTFTTSDNGTHTFPGVTRFIAGIETLTAKDKANSSITGTTTVAVSAASANHFLITAPPTAVAGTSFNMTVAALDPYGNADTSYRGTVILISSDHYTRPSDSTFTQSDSGTHVFGVSLFTAEVQTLLVRDAAHGAITGTTTVTVQAAPADHFLVTAPSTAASGMPFDVIVTALDTYGNIDTDYHGTVIFTTSDLGPGVVLPTAYTFTAGTGGDNGVHDFLSGVTLITPGDQSFTATNTVSGITGTATVTVTPGAAAPPGGRTSKPGSASLVVDPTQARSVSSSRDIASLDGFFALLNQDDSGFHSAHRKHPRQFEALSPSPLTTRIVE